MDIGQVVTVGAAVVGYVFAWFKSRETKAVQDFFDPESDVVSAPRGTPTRSYYMSDAVKSFVVQDAEPDEQGDIHRQIQDAESRMDETGKAVPYIILFRSGRWYRIEYGQISGGGSPGAPVPTL